MKKIHLSDYCRNGNFELVTRTQGILVRTNSQIDAHIANGGCVEIIIPQQVFSLGHFFLEEFLESAIFKLGRKGFSNQVTFVSEGRYRVNHDLDQVLDRVLGEEEDITKCDTTLATFAGQATLATKLW